MSATADSTDKFQFEIAGEEGKPSFSGEIEAGDGKKGQDTIKINGRQLKRHGLHLLPDFLIGVFIITIVINFEDGGGVIENATDAELAAMLTDMKIIAYMRKRVLRQTSVAVLKLDANRLLMNKLSEEVDKKFRSKLMNLLTFKTNTTEKLMSLLTFRTRNPTSSDIFYVRDSHKLKKTDVEVLILSEEQERAIRDLECGGRKFVPFYEAISSIGKDRVAKPRMSVNWEEAQRRLERNSSVFARSGYGGYHYDDPAMHENFDDWVEADIQYYQDSPSRKGKTREMYL